MSVTEYRTVVGVTPRSKRPIYGTRYLVKCECGWSANCSDYIAYRQAWRQHKAECLARKP